MTITHSKWCAEKGKWFTDSILVTAISLHSKCLAVREPLIKSSHSRVASKLSSALKRAWNLLGPCSARLEGLLDRLGLVEGLLERFGTMPPGLTNSALPALGCLHVRSLPFQTKITWFSIIFNITAHTALPVCVIACVDHIWYNFSITSAFFPSTLASHLPLIPQL